MPDTVRGRRRAHPDPINAETHTRDTVVIPAFSGTDKKPADDKTGPEVDRRQSSRRVKDGIPDYPKTPGPHINILGHWRAVYQGTPGLRQSQIFLENSKSQ